MSKAKSKDIKEAIKAFIHHVETLENAENPDENGFEAEYSLIQKVQVKNREENVFPMDVGKIEKNLKKNRYKDILPYDHHRVVLSVVGEDPDSDYINASKLMGVKGSGGYIATQGPLSVTVNDFWRMIWEYNIEIVFMACRIVEIGKIKCKQYWNDLGQSEEFGDITVFTEAEENIMFDCVRRNFRVVRGEEVHHVVQFHYSGWPDHGIPDDAGHIRDMIGVMRQARHNSQAPLLVHCSAGCGRTGAIIAIDYVWTLLEEGMFDGTFSLFDLICNFRQQRMSMVQTADQYAFLNKVLKSLCEEWLTKLASHTYENVMVDQASDIDGENPSTSSKRATGENLYENDRVGNHLEEKQLALKAEGSSIVESRLADGSEELKLSHPSDGKNTNSSLGYENVHLNEGKKDSTPRTPLQGNGVNSEKKIHKTIVHVGPGSPTKQAHTSGLKGQRDPWHLAQNGHTAMASPSVPTAVLNSFPASNSSHSSTNEFHTSIITVHKSQPPTPQNEAFYSSLNKPGPIPLPVDAAYDTLSTSGPISPRADAGHTFNKKSPISPGVDAAYDTLRKPGPIPPPADAGYDTLSKLGPVSPTTDTSTVHKKTSKAPEPPAQSLKPPLDEPVYSTINKKSPLKSPGAGCPPVLPRKPSLSDEKFVYNTINDCGSTAYEVIDFPTSPSSRNQSTSSVESSRGRNPSTSTTNQSPRQLNSRSLPGFSERLPRVRGPIPMPQSWNKA